MCCVCGLGGLLAPVSHLASLAAEMRGRVPFGITCLSIDLSVTDARERCAEKDTVGICVADCLPVFSLSHNPNLVVLDYSSVFVLGVFINGWPIFWRVHAFFFFSFHERRLF